MSNKKKFRVWIGQVNQTNYEIRAENIAEAREKAARKWRRENKPSADYAEEITTNTLLTP